MTPPLNPPLNQDTRKLLVAGTWIFGTGLFCVALLFTIFGGTTQHGPHTNGGWLMLIIAMGCVPTGLLPLALGVAKWIGQRSR